MDSQRDRTTTEHRPTADAAPAGVALDFLAPAQGPDELGRLGHYRVLRVVGMGGMGLVLLAEDTRLDRRVALKVMLPKHAEDPTARQRFLREAKLAAQLEHDHIVPIYHVDEDRGVPYLAMPLLTGQSLEAALRQAGRLTVAHAVRVGAQIADGLAVAHDRGLVHRDIKPGNIWLEGDHGGRVKLLDFGLARSVQADTGVTQSGTILGTPAYMPPEQARGAAVDHRCDLYALGCVLYRMTTGELPFRGADTMALLLALATQEPVPPRQRNPEVPEPLNELILQLLAKDARRRPDSARDVAHRLRLIEPALAPGRPRPDAAKDTAPVVVQPPPTIASPGATVTARPVPPRHAVRRWACALIGVALVLVALPLAAVGVIAVLFLATMSPGHPQGEVGAVQQLAGKGAAAEWALAFDGKTSSVEVPTLRLDGNDPVTLEALVTLDREADHVLLMRVAGQRWLAMSGQDGAWNLIGFRDDRLRAVTARGTLARGVRTHVAGGWDGQRLRLFVNGKEASERIDQPQKERTIQAGQRGVTQIGGAAEGNVFLAGKLHGVRASRGARYTRDFTPPERLDQDGDTLALYRCDEGQGDQLNDSSGNKHHGKIIAAKWVPR